MTLKKQNHLSDWDNGVFPSQNVKQNKPHFIKEKKMKPNYYITIQLKDKTLWVTEGFSLDDGINNLMAETRFNKDRFIKEIHTIIAKNFYIKEQNIKRKQ
jgi:hypothetical protein